MLILSRRADESIVIGDEIVITILSVKGKQVRVGITAPPDVSVHREEIYQRIQSGEVSDEPEEASGVVPGTVDLDESTRAELAADDAINGNIASGDHNVDDDAGNR